MENLASIKAVFVNELQFTPKQQRKAHFSDQMVITHPYTDKYEAQVAVKVGNLVHTVTLKEMNHYVSPTYGDTPTPSLDLDYFDLTRESKGLFAPLTEAGIDIDFSDIYTQYFAEVEKAKHHTLLIKRFKTWEKIRDRRKAYYKSWMHTFEATIKSDRNKKVLEAAVKATFTPPTEGEVCNGATAKIFVLYRGFTGMITSQDGRFVFNSKDFYEYPEGVRPEENAYSFQREVITSQRYDGVTRKTKRAATTFLKMTEAVDEYLAICESRKTRSSNEAQQREERRAHLESIAGYPVVTLQATKYSKDYRGRSDGSYIQYSFNIITEQPTSSHGSHEGHQISVREDDNGIKTYSLRGLSKLDEHKFKAILDIVLEGEEVHTSLVYPKE